MLVLVICKTIGANAAGLKGKDGEKFKTKDAEATEATGRIQAMKLREKNFLSGSNDMGGASSSAGQADGKFRRPAKK